MTYRERKQRRMERRQEWAAKRTATANAAGRSALEMGEIMGGEPIKVGHHSEGRHRNHIDKMDGLMHKAAESSEMASKHRGIAGGIADQLDTSIYRDDLDELERLEEKLGTLSAQRDRRKAINVWLRKNSGIKRNDPNLINPDVYARAGEAIKACADALDLSRDEALDLVSALKYNASLGYPSYSLTNLGANIRRVEQRIPAARQRAVDVAKVKAWKESEGIDAYDEYL